MSIETFRGFVHRGAGNLECSTAVLHTLLSNQASPETMDALFHNMKTMYDLAVLVSLELKKNGIYPHIIFTDGPQASNLFTQMAKQARHGAGYLTFMGGAVLTKNMNPRHVVGIASVHEKKRPKITIVDTAPKLKRKFVRQVPYSWLTRNVATPEYLYENELPAFGVIGENLPSFFGKFPWMEGQVYEELYNELTYRGLMLERAFGSYE